MEKIEPIGRHVAQAAVLVVVALLLAACSSTLDADDLKEQISAELENTYEVEATVECPEDVDAEGGGEFECTATDTEGNSMPVQVVQSDDEGNVDWSMDVFNLPVIEEELEPEVSSTVDAEITITCPRILVSASEGSSLDCTATDDTGGEGILRITSIDAEGNVEWELNP